MPLLYGEGEAKAMYRLQKEILQTSDDETIFAWSLTSRESEGLLAPSPWYFRKSAYTRPISDICRAPRWKGLAKREGWSITNRGLNLRLGPNLWLEHEYDARDGSHHWPAITCVINAANFHTPDVPFCLRLYLDHLAGCWRRVEMVLWTDLPKQYQSKMEQNIKPLTICINLRNEESEDMMSRSMSILTSTATLLQKPYYGPLYDRLFIGITDVGVQPRIDEDVGVTEGSQAPTTVQTETSRTPKSSNQ